jgi:hypothetical protein
MAAIVWSDVTAQASELTAVSAGAQANILGLVNAWFNASEFTDGEDGHFLKMARIYLAAHMATMERTAAGGAAGPVTSESAGGLARSYANLTGAMSPSSWANTRYGALLETIISVQPARAWVAL